MVQRRLVRGRWHRLLLLVALLVQLLPAATVMAQGADTPGEETEIRFEDYALETVDYTLPNGLRVILAQDSSAPVVAVDLWYHVGGANDPEGRAGFAHLFEHIMFEGSENIAEGEWDRLLEPIGARNNAYTVNDQTVYWEVAPSYELPRILWMEADRMRSLNVTEEAFVNQRDVVIQEYNQRYANAPYGLANTRLFTQPMAEWFPYARPVIGDVEDLQAATFAEVAAFHEQYYKPNNATLAVVGDIDIAQTQALIQAYFADIPAGEPVPSILAEYPMPADFPVVETDPETGCLIGTHETLIDPQIRVPRWALTVVAPPRGDPDYYALDLLTGILSAGNASRLERNIVQQGEATAAFVGTNPLLGATILYGIVIPNSGQPVEPVMDRVLEEIAAIRSEGVTQAELDRIKRQLVVNALTSYRASVYDTAEWLQDATQVFDNPDSIVAELEMYEAVTLEDIQRVAQTYFCERPMNTQLVLSQGEPELIEGAAGEAEPVEVTPTGVVSETLVLPQSEIAALPAGTVTTNTVPGPLGEATADFPPSVTFTLDNGLKVIFVEQHEVPKVQLQLVVGGSDKAAPPEQQGVASLMAALLTQGTVKKSAETIATLIESVGGSISASAVLEWTQVSVNALTTDVELAFDLLSEVARYSVFPPSEFAVAQTQELTLLDLNAGDPATLADRQFSRVAFPGHPYGYLETTETVSNLTRQDVREFHRTYYRPNNALLVIVGDLSAEEARRLTEDAFGAWMSKEVPDYLDYPARGTADTSVIYLVDRPDSEQATIQIGNVAIDARNPDRYALEVANAVLGSGSSSRLFVNLREDKGYTYGVFSRFARPNDEASFRVIGNFNPANAGDAIREILMELERMQAEPISEQELSDAKGKIIGGFALAMEDPSVYADQLAVRALTGVPLEELDQYLPAIEAVTAEEVQAAAVQYIDTESPIIIVVGNADVLRPQLEEIAPVRVVNTDGEVVE